MGVGFDVYGIGGTVYAGLDELGAHRIASKHFDCNVHARLNNVLVYWVETCQVESLYLIMDRKWDDV